MRCTLALPVFGIGSLLLGLSDTAAALNQGDILVVDNTLDAVVRVNPTSGNRTIVSDSSTGTGTNFDQPWGIAVDLSAPVRVPSISFTGLALLAGLVLGSVAWARRCS